MLTLCWPWKSVCFPSYNCDHPLRQYIPRWFFPLARSIHITSLRYLWHWRSHRQATASPAHLLWWNQSPIVGKLFIASLGRILFIPLFLIRNISGLARQSSPFITSDIAYLLILLLFAISGGYLINIAMMGTSSVEYNYRLWGEVKLGTDGSGNDTVEGDLAANIAQFCLIGGLLSGSIMSLGVKNIIYGGCNPVDAWLSGDTLSS